MNMPETQYKVSTGLPAQPYEHEWRRSVPDYLVYHPAPDGNPRWHDDAFFFINEHFIVQPIDDTHLIATWTAHGPACRFRRVVVARSNDGGHTWTAPDVLDGGPDASAAWSVPLVSPSGRIYLLYSDYRNDHRLHGGACRLAWRVSDDAGATWSEVVCTPLRSSPVDESADSYSFIFWRQAEYDANGRPLLAFTRIGTCKAYADLHAKRKWTQAECLRIDNIHDNPDPCNLVFSYLPRNVEDAITVPQPEDANLSWANEPNFVPLPDGRIIVILRTRWGRLYWTVSDDTGTFGPVEVMRYCDDGDEILQPGSPAPLFSLADGRYLLVFNNNDGTAFGAADVHDCPNRRPCYLAVGTFDAAARQPITFGPPQLFIDNDNIPIDAVGNEPRYEAGAYGSLTEINGRRVFWYPDRKHFLLGKRIGDNLL